MCEVGSRNGNIPFKSYRIEVAPDSSVENDASPSELEAAMLSGVGGFEGDAADSDVCEELIGLVDSLSDVGASTGFNGNWDSGAKCSTASSLEDEIERRLRFP
jgi:hypothetical protein